MLEAITRCDRHPLKCYIEPPTVNIVISKLTMALEDKKIKYLKWIIYSIWNRDHKLGEAVKLLGWFGVFLGIFLCAVSLYTFSSAGDLKNKDETYITALYVMGGIYMGVGLVHIIFNIALLVKIGQSFVGEKEDTEIYQLIRTSHLDCARPSPLSAGSSRDPQIQQNCSQSLHLPPTGWISLDLTRSGSLPRAQFLLLPPAWGTQPLRPGPGRWWSSLLPPVSSQPLRPPPQHDGHTGRSSQDIISHFIIKESNQASQNYLII